MKNKLIVGVVFALFFYGKSYASQAFIFDTEPEKVKIPIIMYHMVTDNSRLQGKYAITPKEFEEDLKYLHENGYETVFIEDLIRFVERGKNLPGKPVVLTFDDGSGSDYYNVYPLLKKYKARAVMSIVGKLADQYSVGEDAAEGAGGGKTPHIGWELAKEMHKSKLVEFQNHSYDLHGGNGSGRRSGENFGDYRKRLTDDLIKAQEGFYKNLGYTPTTFTYPLGIISEGSEEILREIGFKASLSCAEGISTLIENEPECLFHLKRGIRSSGHSVKDILKNFEADDK